MNQVTALYVQLGLFALPAAGVAVTPPHNLNLYAVLSYVVGIATELRAARSRIESRGGARFSARPDRPWGPPSLLYNEHRVFPGGKLRPGRAADHSPPSSAVVVEV